MWPEGQGYVVKEHTVEDYTNLKNNFSIQILNGTIKFWRNFSEKWISLAGLKILYTHLNFDHNFSHQNNLFSKLKIFDWVPKPR